MTRPAIDGGRSNAARIISVAFFCLMSALCMAKLHAQNSIRLGASTVSLTGPWKFHTGDDPRWKNPAFDDSPWEEVSLAPKRIRRDPTFGGTIYIPGWTAKGHAGHYGYAWYRLQLEVASPHEGLALQMPFDYDDAYQVYANGLLIGQDGHFTARGVSATFSRLHVFFLPPFPADGRMTIAVRMYMRPDTALNYPESGGMHSAPVLGLAQTLISAPSAARNVRLRVSLFDIPTLLVCFFVAVVAVGFFLLDRTEKAYLWLAAATVALALLNALDFATYLVPSIGIDSAMLVETALLLPLSCLFWFFFWTSWFRLRPEKRLDLLAGAGAAAMALLALMLNSPVFGTLVPVRAVLFLRPMQTGVALAYGALLLWVAYRGIRRHGVDGWLALGPIAFLSLSLFQYPLQSAGIPVNFFFAGVRITLYNITAILSLLAISVLLLRRFLAGQRERERVAGEFKAAHTMQSLALQGQELVTSQFAVETAYQPAREVGGDFFQVLPADGGAMMVVVGDVSGKGLRAAMTVATIIGALRREDSRQPRIVLKELNRVLTGRGEEGFTTCVCVLVDAGGRATLANAGHLPPYLNGAEIPVYGGLPLGLVEDLTCDEMHFQMTSGDRLTLVSDGVVEARDASGTLFGFERTREISRQPPSAIVEAARGFGQQDDITALTISFLAQPVEALA